MSGGDSNSPIVFRGKKYLIEICKFFIFNNKLFIKKIIFKDLTELVPPLLPNTPNALLPGILVFPDLSLSVLMMLEMLEDFLRYDFKIINLYFE
jgi:hypothetical protein